MLRTLNVILPACRRCDNPLISYAGESWHITQTADMDDPIRHNDTVLWTPESLCSGRCGNWLEHFQDWAISRTRYCGTPLTIWQCACGHRECIGSRAELSHLAGDP
jgi:Isoleucyl-tRNA synthetase